MVDHLHGHAHGSDERRLPHRSLIVPPEQIDRNEEVPCITQSEARKHGLVTFSELIEAGADRHKLRLWIGMGRIVPLARLRGGIGSKYNKWSKGTTTRDTRPLLFHPQQIAWALKKYKPGYSEHKRNSR